MISPHNCFYSVHISFNPNVFITKADTAFMRVIAAGGRQQRREEGYFSGKEVPEQMECPTHVH